MMIRFGQIAVFFRENRRNCAFAGAPPKRNNMSADRGKHVRIPCIDHWKSYSYPRSGGRGPLGGNGRTPSEFRRATTSTFMYGGRSALHLWPICRRLTTIRSRKATRLQPLQRHGVALDIGLLTPVTRRRKWPLVLTRSASRRVAAWREPCAMSWGPPQG